MSMRWDPGFICSGEQFEPFWGNLADNPDPKRRGLLIAGRGIDPRTVVGPAAIKRSGFPITACWLIRLMQPFDSPGRPRSKSAAEHEETVRGLYADSAFDVKEIQVLNENGRLVGSAQIRSLLSDLKWLTGFSDVIVDITALPTSVSFPLLGILIAISDSVSKDTAAAFNLHCVVCENPDIDEIIVSDGGDVAEYIDPFRGRGGLTGGPDPITIWAPVLGERQSVSLGKIYEMVSPAEVKPFLPFPSRNPRRGDDLVSAYRLTLFETWQVDPRGFIYVDERDPFDIYRQIGELAEDYEQFLKPLGSTNTVVSSHSSKLLSLGVLLAAFEHKLAVAHVEPTGYRLEGAPISEEANEMFEIWLTGEAYEVEK